MAARVFYNEDDSKSSKVSPFDGFGFGNGNCGQFVGIESRADDSGQDHAQWEKQGRVGEESQYAKSQK